MFNVFKRLIREVLLIVKDAWLPLIVVIDSEGVEYFIRGTGTLVKVVVAFESGIIVARTWGETAFILALESAWAGLEGTCAFGEHLDDDCGLVDEGLKLGIDERFLYIVLSWSREVRSNLNFKSFLLGLCVEGCFDVESLFGRVEWVGPWPHFVAWEFIVGEAPALLCQKGHWYY